MTWCYVAAFDPLSYLQTHLTSSEDIENEKWRFNLPVSGITGLQNYMDILIILKYASLFFIWILERHYGTCCIYFFLNSNWHVVCYHLHYGYSTVNWHVECLHLFLKCLAFNCQFDSCMVTFQSTTNLTEIYNILLLKLFLSKI